METKNFSKERLQIMENSNEQTSISRFLPNKLGNWLQKSHSMKIWSYDERNGKLIAQRNKKYLIFERSNLTERRTKEDKFICCETWSSYTEKSVQTTALWQGCSQNIAFMQGYSKTEILNMLQMGIYFFKYMTNTYR